MTKREIQMGYKKTISRDEISGLWQQNDVSDGTWSVDELTNRAADRQSALNKAIENDWPANMTATTSDCEAEVYGNAGSRLPRPTDYSSKGQDRFGLSVSPGEQKAKKAPRDNSDVSR